MENMLSPADVAVLSGNTGSNNDGWGGNGAWWIILFLIFGWGRNGFGNGSGGGAMDNYVLNSDFATLSRQISDGFNSTERRTDQIINGLCDGFYTNAQLINGVNTNILTTGNGIQTQLASCCCDIREAISGVNYNNALNTTALTNQMTINTRDIIDNQNANYRALHDEIVANRIEDKNAQIQAQQNEINALRLAASQEKQNNYLVNELRPCPIPAYITCNPFASTNACGCNNGCGF